ncbi:MauE/DoxX family redox-associated membrane protein [Rubritalea marina]|uniref:MauE/DoxX family redox-associated membrane protein n=1 Tax=Rubritalea marina TaxID=361055 RepID=UPI000371BFDF|nr:MauE/DoxX family redox-associated membrane protein [Rubritalea marina]
MSSCCAPKQENTPSKAQKPGIKAYRPLIIVIGLSLLFACAKNYQYMQLKMLPSLSVVVGGEFAVEAVQSMGARLWMHDMMGSFLMIFAMLKLFDVDGFTKAFRKYDLVAKAVPAYAGVYPLIELLLGLGYLSGWRPEVVYTATLVIMGSGSLGVLLALPKRDGLQCACMGATLNVPLTTVALIENLGMVAMAAWMLLA